MPELQARGDGELNRLCDIGQGDLLKRSKKNKTFGMPDEHPLFEAWPRGSSPARADLESVASRLNSVLERYSDKDWAYSRIALKVSPLADLDAPYVLWLEWIEAVSPEGH